MSSERTGYALGRLDPVIYYENKKGHLILAPSTDLARMCYEKPNGAGKSLRSMGYEMREAGTLAEVDRLQKRMVAQEMGTREKWAERDELTYALQWKATGDKLRSRMISKGCSAYERDFIQAYLSLREEKRDRHRQRWTETAMYLHARENDSGTSLVERLKAEDGDKWERGS